MARSAEKLIGLSFTSCIRDIAEGVVPPTEVKAIIAGTHYNFHANMPENSIRAILEDYRKLEWRGCYEKAEAIAIAFIKADKVVEPRALGGSGFSTAAGHWMNAQTRQVIPKLQQAEFLHKLGIKSAAKKGTADSRLV